MDLSEVEYQLARIANILEGFLSISNPLPLDYEGLEDKPELRTFYTDEDKEIIRHKLAQLGKKYKERV